MAIDFVAIDEDDVALAEHLRVELPAAAGRRADPWHWLESARRMRHVLADADIWDWIDDHEIHLLGIERPYGPNRQSIASLHTILGAVLSCLPQRIDAYVVTPAEMRLELGLPGNCAKEVMHEEIRRRLGSRAWPAYGYDAWPPDGYDAWAAGHAALRINERGTEEER